MSDTELSVVCKSCGSEVSPYVTECPYCGTRLRKRAPKLERVGDEWWRYLAAPFVYDDVGYLFACGLAIAIFLPAIERRVGSFATLLLVLGCGSLGALAADGLDSSFGDGVAVVAGGNGIALGAVAAYAVIRDAERRADPTEEYDRIALAVAAIVLLLLPLVEDYASAVAGVVGGLIGGACGLAAALGGRTTGRR